MKTMKRVSGSRASGRSSYFLGCSIRLSMIASAAMLASFSAGAMQLDTGDSDFAVRWDNTVRANVGIRAQKRAGEIDNAFGFPYDQSNAKFADRGDFITKRIDLLSEVDVTYKGKLGARVSAAAWYDDAYGNRAAHTSNPSAYINDDYTSVVKRYYHGPSGEFLDAYVYNSFDLGSVAVSARLGQHALIWGEGLFGSTNSVAYSQAPSDGRKSAANPGASAKETALPMEQISAVAQINDEMSLAGFYGFKWYPNRVPEGGTYFAGADTILEGPNVGRERALNGKSGDVGVSLRWRPQWLGQGTISFYARRFDEKNSWASQLNTATNLRRAVYARDVQLYGMSLTTIVGDGVSLGSEISYRKNMPLNSTGQAGLNSYGARGDTLHALVNGVKAFSQSSWYSSAVVSAELSMSHLVKVTENEALFKGNNNSACATQAILSGCSSTNAYNLGVSFSPSWMQALPGVDLSMPIFASYNFKGNAATNGGGFEGFKTLKLTVSALAYSKHQLDLSFTRYWSKTGVISGRQTVLGAPYNDKGNVTLTYQTTF